jgi:hypothetical protein
MYHSPESFPPFLQPPSHIVVCPLSKLLTEVDVPYNGNNAMYVSSENYHAHNLRANARSTYTQTFSGISKFYYFLCELWLLIKTPGVVTSGST